MIVHLHPDCSEEQAKEITKKYDGYLFSSDPYKFVCSSAVRELALRDKEIASATFNFNSDIQLASKDYIEKRTVVISEGLKIGGNTNNTIVITGPCSVESKEQIESAAAFSKDLGLKVLRAGAFKPRTSPYSFQGLGKDGLKLLDEVRSTYGLKIISEAKDSSHIDDIIEYADIIQVGAKAMYDQSILKACGKTNKPVLIKRGFGSTLQEFVQAAEFVLSAGNPNVILCERGIRTFETKTRFTLDLCGVAFLKEKTNLPVFLDPSHAMGYRYGVPDLTRACLAMGIDGLLIEVHPTPDKALSDSVQQLNHHEMRALFDSLEPIAKAVGRNLI